MRHEFDIPPAPSLLSVVIVIVPYCEALTLATRIGQGEKRLQARGERVKSEEAKQ